MDNNKEIKYIVNGETYSLSIPLNWVTESDESIKTYFATYFVSKHGTADVKILRGNLSEGVRLIKG